jgi:DNA polymerase I-like protein with 3'-5' exonuclease and polymerase domains
MSVATKNYDIVRSTEELAQLWNEITSQGKPTGFDIETGYHGEDQDRGSLRLETNLLVGFSFTNSLNWARYCPMAHDFAENITDHLTIAEILWKNFQSGLIVAHNAGFELRRMARFFRETLSEHPLLGEQVRSSNGYFPVRSDTQVEAYIEREFQEFGLKDLVWKKFNHQMIKFEQLFEHLTEKKKKAFRFNVLDLTSQVVTYACEDALWCLALHLKQYPKVKDQLVYKVDMEIVYVICEMEDCGIRYDWFFMQDASQRAKEFTSLLNDEIQDELANLLGLGETKLNINLGSPKQLSEILYDKLGLTVNIFTTGSKGAASQEDKKMSTGKMALEMLAEKNPVVKKISNYKNMKRLTTSFLDKYAKDYGYAPDGMVHSSLNQSFVRTARFSSANPNQQNQPSVNLKDDDGKHATKCDGGKCTGCKTPLSYFYKLADGTSFKLNFRDSVIAPKDHYIIGFDLSQAEYRAVAGHANETAMIKAFESGVDIHEFVASMMFKIPINEVTKQYRSKAKTIGFGLLYGMTSQALAKRLNCSQEEAQELFDQYFAAFPKIKRWTEQQVEFGYEHGYVMTKFGRKIPVWELYDDVRWKRQGGERACFNYPIQGGATGDYLRIAMVRARKAIRKAGLQDKIKLFMNVHDALEYYVHRSVGPADAIALLQPAVAFPVPGWPMMKADWHLGKRWGSVKELKLNEDSSITVVEDGKTFSLRERFLPTLQEDLVTDSSILEEEHPRRERFLPTLQTNEKFTSTQEIDQKLAEKVYKEDPEGYGPGQQSERVVVILETMPTDKQWIVFNEFLDRLSGGSRNVLLQTPEGEMLMPQTDLRISKEDHEKFISRIFGNVEVRYEFEGVSRASFARLTEGIAF